MKRTWIFVFLAILSLPAFSQQDGFFPRELTVDDTATLEAIALYPEEDRKAILEVCKYPSFLVALDAGQEKTQQAFQDIISGYDREDQEKFYELVRYPGLVEQLVEGGKKSKTEIETINKEYPEEIHETSLELGRRNYEDLDRIAQLTVRVKSNFRELISRYPEETKEAARRIVQMPEVVSLLVESLSLTVMLGEAYRSNPEQVLAQAEEYARVVARRNAEELADYQEQLKQDPEAYEEMVAAADKYAEDNNIQDHRSEQSPEVRVQVVHHYPYWFGYPYWYTYPTWRPVPWYYHTGFYYGPGGGVVFIGMPSPYYVGWHHTYYPNRYTHLSFHYHRHYYRHPYSRSSFHRSVNVNVNRNTNVNINRSVYAGSGVSRSSRNSSPSGVTRTNRSQTTTGVTRTDRNASSVRQPTSSATRQSSTYQRSTTTRESSSTRTSTSRSTTSRSSAARTSSPSYSRHQATQSLQQSRGSSTRTTRPPSRSSAPSRSAPRRR